MNDIAKDTIGRLNAGERVTLYKLVVDEAPGMRFVGEIRYIVPLVPASWEPLASMMPLGLVPILWDGTQWVAGV